MARYPTPLPAELDPVALARLNDHGFSGAVTEDGSIEVVLASNWGIDSAGTPYYDAAGADPADAVWPALDSDGSFVLTQLAGGTA